MVAGTESNPGRVKIKIASQAVKIGFRSYKKYWHLNIFMELAGNFSADLNIGKWGELNLPNHPISVKLTHSFTIVHSIRKND